MALELDKFCSSLFGAESTVAVVVTDVVIAGAAGAEVNGRRR